MGYIGHADQGELIDYLRLTPEEKLIYIFLVHGEVKQSLILEEKISSVEL